MFGNNSYTVVLSGTDRAIWRFEAREKRERQTDTGDLSIKKRKECGNTGIDGDRAGECPKDSHRPGQTCPDLYSSSAQYRGQTAVPDTVLGKARPSVQATHHSLCSLPAAHQHCRCFPGTYLG